MTKSNSDIKIIVRIPKLLHEYLKIHAEGNNISTNKYCNFLLSNTINDIRYTSELSGNLTLRIPINIYNNLKMLSSENNTSINQILVYLLSKSLSESEYSKKSILNKLNSFMILNDDDKKIEINNLNTRIHGLKSEIIHELIKLTNNNQNTLEKYQIKYLEKKYPLICYHANVQLIIPILKIVISCDSNIRYNYDLKNYIDQKLINSENHKYVLYTIGNINEMNPSISYKNDVDLKKVVIYILQGNINQFETILENICNILNSFKNEVCNIQYNLQPTYLLEELYSIREENN